MLRKYSNSRTLNDNLKLGGLTAFAAGMVNVAAFLIFFSFASNVTGYFAIFTSELVKGNLYQFAIVGVWILAFFSGGFIANFIIIHFQARNAYLAHALPIILEILCLLGVGIYGDLFYRETLQESEVLLTLTLLAMGLQNGLTASLSNFVVKTTHLTGATTDLALLLSMFTRKEYRNNKTLVGRAKLIMTVMASYTGGALLAALCYQLILFKVFYIVCALLFVVIGYDFYKIRSVYFMRMKARNNRMVLAEQSRKEAYLLKRKASGVLVGEREGA